jgi:putative chitinase
MLLKIGSKGDAVKKVQSKLGLIPDGVFGPQTANKVKEWQKQNGLSVDGIIGEKTWRQMFDVPKPVSSKPIINENCGPINIEKLRGHIPDNVLQQLPETMKRFEINTPLRLAHFLSQCGHESAGFKVTQENLNYSRDGLLRVFPKYFNSTIVESYAKQPEKIASRVYGGRMGNGPEPTREGFKFRGRGYIQLTGKNNYVAFGNAINENLVDNPDLVATKYPLLSAAWFFHKNCLRKCDAGSSDVVITNITRCVNGGSIGLNDRIKHFREYYNLLK